MTTRARAGADGSLDEAVRRVVVLGSTGSIGVQALDVIAAHPERLAVVALGAGGGQLEQLAEQVVATRVGYVAIFDPDAAVRFPAMLRATAERLGVAEHHVDVWSGGAGMERLAGLDCEVVLNGITGSVGLGPTLAALAAGNTLALANKESLVAGGALVRQAMTRADQLVPVDSEHSALAQCLRSGRSFEVRRLLLTASGGPFRGKSRAELAGVSPAQALAHPTWSMGPVVTINSSTMMNKALELIEAHLLFDIAPELIDVVVHPQSYVHSMVEFRDGSVIAQVSPPDMRLPIALGLSWPSRLDGVTAPVDWSRVHDWHFEPLDDEVFPAVGIARAALQASPLHPAALNAANEVLVAAFLDGEIGYLSIVESVARVLDRASSQLSALDPNLEGVARAERLARGLAREIIAV